MQPKIIDAFIFYNELDMLEFRLTELDSVVDHFVLVEATTTFAGKPKPLFYAENKDRYEKFNHKITHVIVDDMPAGGDAWTREIHQRNCIRRGVLKISPAPCDLIIISDCDEIPDTNMLQRFKEQKLHGGVTPIQDFYYYNLTCKARVGLSRCRVMDYSTFNTKSPEAHTKHRYRSVQNGGWHFSYFGDENFIVNKIQQFSHQEFNNSRYTDSEAIKNRVKKCEDLFGRNVHGFFYQPIDSNKYLPNNYEMLLKFQNTPPPQ